FNASSGDSRHVQQVIKQSSHVARLTFHDLASLVHSEGRHTGRPHHTGGADDGGQRIPQLMRKHSEELLTTAGTGANAFPCALSIGDVDERQNDAHYVSAAKDGIAPAID